MKHASLITSVAFTVLFSSIAMAKPTLKITGDLMNYENIQSPKCTIFLPNTGAGAKILTKDLEFKPDGENTTKAEWTADDKSASVVLTYRPDLAMSDEVITPHGVLIVKITENSVLKSSMIQLGKARFDAGAGSLVCTAD